MTLQKLVCTACACLCDDIEIEVEDNCITKIKNACITGSSFIYASKSEKQRSQNMIEGKNVSTEEALKKAASLLKESKKPLLFGFDKSTIEAQAKAIELAETLGATIDDNSSFCKGELVKTILKKINNTCSFEEAKESDAIIFWGSNPYQSHPRHLSTLSYYTHKKYKEEGWYPDVTLITVEIRDTEIMDVCDQFIKILPGDDINLISSILAILDGKEGTEDAKEIVDTIKISKFCVIYTGLGLDYSLNSDYELFNLMIKRLGELSRIAVIPMIGHYNMLGFNKQLYEKTGFVNKVNFSNGTSHKPEFSFIEQIRNKEPDCILIMGSDPMTSLPQSLLKNFEGIPLITIDPYISATTEISQVVLSSAISSLETGGNAIRMDWTNIPLSNCFPTKIPSDEELINQLIEMVK